MDEAELNFRNYVMNSGDLYEKKWYSKVADINMSENKRDVLANSIHNLLVNHEEPEVMKIILDISRVNPLFAVYTLQSCVLNLYEQEFCDVLYFYAKNIMQGYHKFLQIDSISFTILLAEALSQINQGQAKIALDLLLKNCMIEDALQYQTTGSRRGQVLSLDHARHIMEHMPVLGQLNFIYWLWNNHLHTVQAYHKTRSFAGQCLYAIMQQIKDCSIWKNIENLEETILTGSEQQNQNETLKILNILVDFACTEARLTYNLMPLLYVRWLLGESDLERKLIYICGEENARYYWKLYEDVSVKTQKNEEIQKKRMKQYEGLVNRVREKYQDPKRENQALGWHNLQDCAHLSLWNYWQGQNFQKVRIMVLFPSFEWAEADPDFFDKLKNMTKMRPVFPRIPEENTLRQLFFYQMKQNIVEYSHKELYFSSLCLGYSSCPGYRITEQDMLDDVREFMPETLEIIQPMAIICLGTTVFNTLHTGMGLPLNNAYTQTFQQGNRIVNIYNLPFQRERYEKEEWRKVVKKWQQAAMDMRYKGILNNATRNIDYRKKQFLLSREI